MVVGDIFEGYERDDHVTITYRSHGNNVVKSLNGQWREPDNDTARLMTSRGVVRRIHRSHIVKIEKVQDVELSRRAARAQRMRERRHGI